MTPDRIPTKTDGGYEVKNFKIMDEPVKRYPSSDLIYSADVYAPLMPKGPKCWQNIQYDFMGRCANFSRMDCFVDIFDYPEA
jgi:hypothetical protein